MSRALIDRVRTRLVLSQATATPDQVARALREEGVVLGDEAVLDLVASLRRDLVGAGLLQPILDQPDVTDVLVNGPDEVWIDRGYGLERTSVRFDGDAAVRALAQRLAGTAGRRLDEANPFVDAPLPDGTRLHAVIPPVSVRHTVLSLRTGRRSAFTLDELVASGTVDAMGAQWLAALVAARLAFLVSGGTGTGKTTVLSALLGLVDHDSRIVIVEDSTELRPTHPHVVCLQSRNRNVEGGGEVTLRDLVRQSLRMRPDRIVVGEVRGAEVVDLLAALNTGHEGGCGTIHANSAAAVPARLEALGLTAGLDRLAAHALVHAGLDAVVHLHRPRKGRRIVAGIFTLVRDRGGFVHAQPALTFSGGRCAPGAGVDALAARLSDSGVTVPAAVR